MTNRRRSPVDDGGTALAHRAPHGRALGLGVDVPEALTPLAYVLPGQLLTDRLAGTLGVNPDAPRGLAKVTRTR